MSTPTPGTRPAELRRAGPGDLDVLLELVAEYCAADGHRFDPEIACAGLTPLLTDDEHGVVWLVDEGAGYAVVTWGWSVEIGGSEAVLDELYVRRRGQGTGGEVLCFVEHDCRRRGVRRIFLETERANTGARRLYARHGFVTESSIWMAKELA